MEELITKIKECKPLYDEKKIDEVSKLVANCLYDNEYYECFDKDMGIEDITAETKTLLMNDKGDIVIDYLSEL